MDYVIFNCIMCFGFCYYSQLPHVLKRLSLNLDYSFQRNFNIRIAKFTKLTFSGNLFKYSWACSIRHTALLNNALFFNNYRKIRRGEYELPVPPVFPHGICLSSLDHFKGSCNCFAYALWKIWDFLFMLIRIIQLTCCFLPLVFLFPITWINLEMKGIWYNLLLYVLEFSGPIFMKLGQWASTRRDLFSEELCLCLSKLQRRTKPHSWFYTKKSLERAFGIQWKHIFVKFDNNLEPIGSGCCAQVYKVWIDPEAISNMNGACNKHFGDSLLVEGIEMLGIGTWLGKRYQDYDDNMSSCEIKMKLDQETTTKVKDMIPVAMKVRHPMMEALLRRDLYIMRSAVSTITWMFPSLKWLSLVDCIEDFAQLMIAQVDFCIEAKNLEKFRENFNEVEAVKFPQPLWPLTTSFLLVETFEEGKSMQHYVATKTANNINARLADLGINTILKMVFQDNFAHGDLHPGNILVKERNINEFNNRTSRSIFPLSLFSKSFSSPFPFTLVILDCGIITSLDDRGRKCLKNVFSAVANGDGEKVAELFLSHSNHECTDPEGFKRRMSEIIKSQLDKSVTLAQIQVSTVMKALFSVMIDHKVKLDGSFSSVILAMMVLEGLGRSLDPTVDIVEKARPFLISSF